MACMTLMGLHTAEIADYANLSFQNKWNFCQKNNVKLKYHFNKLDARPASWSKVAMLLNTEYDWALWVDADAWIVDNSFDFSMLIDDRYDMVMSMREGNINMGVFMLKKCDYMMEIFKTINGMHEYYNHCWWEQGAMIELMKSRPDILPRIKFIDDTLFNCSLDKLNENTKILHLAGCDNNGRSAKFNELIKNEECY